MNQSWETEPMDTADLRKSRGAFFTPEPVCHFMADWAVRSVGDSVLEPACGEAAFMEASVRRLADLGASPSKMHISGTDIHEPSAPHSPRPAQKARREGPSQGRRLPGLEA